MKLQTEPRKFESSGIQETIEYGIEVTAQAMEVLSGLYSDIPWAIVREYGTNMLDAYVKLPPDAKRIPPQLHVPNPMEPWIEFKDFGVGMSAETVRRIFTTYFASTKRDNNDEVGGLGLGSKTAFCYEAAEAWTIESRYAGRRYVFHATRSESHIPALLLVGEFETQEPNGVTIRIPVAQGDVSTFRNRCERLVRFYPMKIEVIGAGQGFNPAPLTYEFRGKNWGLRKRAGTDPSSTVIMGNVPYPVVDAEMRNTKFHQFIPFYGTSSPWALDMWVPIGAVKFTPSREALMYTERTRKQLVASVDEFFKELPDHAAARIQNADTQWDALIELRKVCVTPIDQIVKTPLWRGIKLNTVDGIRIAATSLPKTATVRRVRNEPHSTVFQAFEVQDTDHLWLHPHSKHFLVLNDLAGKDGDEPIPVRVIQLVRRYMMSECTQRVTWKQKREWASDGHAYVFAGIKANALRKLFGGAPVTLASALVEWEENLKAKEPDKAANLLPGSKPRKKTKVRTLNDKNLWEEAEVDATAGGYFVSLWNDDPIDRETKFGLQRNGTRIGTSEVSEIRTWGRILNYMKTSEEIFGIPRSCKSIENKPGWVDVVEYVEEKTKEDLKDFWPAVVTWRTWEEALKGPFGEVFEIFFDSQPKPTVRGFKYWQRVNKDVQSFRRARALSHLARVYNIQPPSNVKALHDGAKVLNAMLEEYPMLVLLQKLVKDHEAKAKQSYNVVPLSFTQYKTELVRYLNSK